MLTHDPLQALYKPSTSLLTNEELYVLCEVRNHLYNGASLSLLRSIHSLTNLTMHSFRIEVGQRDS